MTSRCLVVGKKDEQTHLEGCLSMNFPIKAVVIIVICCAALLISTVLLWQAKAVPIGLPGAYADAPDVLDMSLFGGTEQIPAATPPLNPPPAENKALAALPRVSGLDMETVVPETKTVMEKFWKIDFSGYYSSCDINRDEIQVTFMSEDNRRIYCAAVDPATRVIVTLGSFSRAGGVTASSSRQDEYVAAASRVLADRLGVDGGTDACCYLPLVMDMTVEDKSVYVVFPRVGLFVELALSDLSPVGYRVFPVPGSLVGFLNANTHPL